MATEAQIIANQQNAQKSTGPRTQEGKENSRGNAIVHGCSTSGPVANATRRELVEKRKVAFRKDFIAPTALQIVLIDLLAEATGRIEMCEDNLDVAFNRQCHRAKYVWDDDRRLDAAELAEKLPKKPQVISLRLKSTRHGCEFLIARWGILAGLLDDKTGWSDELKSQALDMLGVEPSHRAGPTILDVPPGGDLVTHLREVITDEVAQLSDAVASFHDGADGYELQTAAAGKNLLRFPDIDRMFRYRNAASREIFKLVELLHGKPSSSKELSPKSSLQALLDQLPGPKAEPAVKPQAQVVTSQAVPSNPPPVAAAQKPTPAPAGLRDETKPIVYETKPISYDSLPISIGRPPVEPAPSKLNRAARRQLARKLATSGR